MHAAGPKPGTRILVVEDDPAISRLLQLELGHRGLDVRPALQDVEDAVQRGIKLRRDYPGCD